jgi:hypothetical protein
MKPAMGDALRGAMRDGTADAMSSVRRALTIALLVVTAAACADKAYTPTRPPFSPKISLQLSTVASAQLSISAKFLVVGAGFDADNNTNGLLAYKIVPLLNGTHEITLPVDISRCLAWAADHGLGACPLLVGASLIDDTTRIASDTTRDPFVEAFDAALLGPFETGPGRLPTIPPIDLSATRYGVIRWEGDDALRLGGNGMPSQITGPITGVVAGAGAPVLFMPMIGFDLANAPNNGPPPGPYPQIGIMQNGSWRRVTATVGPLNAFFTDVTAFAANDAYMAAFSGVYRYDGTAISKVPAITDSIYAIASASPNATTKLVIAGAQGGSVWIGNTQTWQRYALGTAQRIDGVCINSANEAFASSSTGGGVWRFDGTAWTQQTVGANVAKVDLQCLGSGLAFVLGNNTAGQAYKWSGGAWQSLPVTGFGSGRTFAMGAVSVNEIYAASDSANVNRVFYRFNGTSWTEVGRLQFGQPYARRPWADPRGGAYVASGFGRVESVNVTGATVVSYQPSLRDVAVTSPTSAFAVGWNMFLARWDGARWTVDRPPGGTSTQRVLHGVWSDGPGNAWAVGNLSTVLRWGGTSWSVVSDNPRPVAAPDNYNAVWGSGTDVWIAGATTMLHCRAPAVCANEQAGGGTLYGLWGTSPTNVYAVGAGGRIMHFTAGAWTAMLSPTARTLVRISGSGPSDIWAVGDSVLIHFDGTQWANVPMTGDLRQLASHAPSFLQNDFQLGLWARNPKEVYLGGENGAIARWDGTNWREFTSVRYRRRINAIAGAPGGCGLAVTEAETEGPAPTLWRGLGPSGCFTAPMTPPLTWP